VAVQPWADVDIEKLAAQVVERDGKFHIMVAFMGAVPMPAVVMDKTGRLIYMNKLAEEHWKVRTKNVIGQPWPTILRLNDRDTTRVVQQSKEVLAGNHARVYVGWHNEGTNLAHMQSVLHLPFHDDDGDVLLGLLVLPKSV